LETVQLDAN